MNKWIYLVLCIALAAVPLSAKKGQGKGHGKDKSKDHKHQAQQSTVEVGVFLAQDRTVIQDYVANPSAGLPPGLAKRGGALPPGLEKHLRKHGQLPPGLQKKLTPFPVALEERLPPLKPGLQRGFLEGRAVIYDGKGMIFDIFVAL